MRAGVGTYETTIEVGKPWGYRDFSDCGSDSTQVILAELRVVV